MEKRNPPAAFGVFKPVDHVVMSFRSPDRANAAAQALAALGYEAGRMTHYTPAQMLAQVDADLAHATPLASLGQELNLVKAHRDLAASGHSFLVVHAPDDDSRQQVATVARDNGARTARAYGRFIIEELIDTSHGENQVPESPSSGLDTPVPAKATR